MIFLNRAVYLLCPLGSILYIAPILSFYDFIFFHHLSNLCSRVELDTDSFTLGEVVKTPVQHLTVSIKIPRICENRLWAIVLLVAPFRESKIKDILHICQICGAHEECKWRNGNSGF